MTNTDDGDGKRKKRAFAIALAVTLFIACFHIAMAASAPVTYQKEEVVVGQPRVVLIATSTEPVSVVVDPDTFLYYASYCESRHRQFDENGDVLQGRVDPDDTGRWQINKRYWLKSAISMGYDIETEHGNYMMAQHILEVQGEGAWSASAPCMAENFGYIMN
jgi:hypothetical protein